ncbi:IclR family transcriptional regulator [Phycicoccus endophyticus]|uniref:Glycerol operon regulatory protein n=1 Tax=Phycicoccus endophyticus TaxID=1690220 RepID=A0A7G9R0Y2_9MICO|nr:IclR family transcriptional regulator [Phycicoccus endophyticus]NHI19551.1 IclR family transcriptional regulator [Phycicoccus endophyticus]QNN49257.1 IclR family transcriptional regulator [Phycicoccus endophyticus]GGL40020.1 IclR family transcriptional regulator [Phycicoccus endophyticus]
MSSAGDTAWCTSTPKRTAADAGHGSGLRSVGTALDVLECFALDGSLGVSDIARRLGVAKSTAHRLLQTLASRGFVEQDVTSGQYRLGIHLYELGQLAQARHALRYAALPVIRHVAAQTGLTVNFAVPDGADTVFVERIENRDGVRILGHMGRRYPAHVTSSGKVIAAYNAEFAEARRRAGFPPRASHTVRSVADWDRELERVRRRGWAHSHSESFEDSSSVAVAVLRGRVAVASVSVFGPTDDIEPRVEQLVPLLVAASHRIARAGSG